MAEDEIDTLRAEVARLTAERDEARKAAMVHVGRATVAEQERDEANVDRKRALRRAYELTLETQTCDEAVADLIRIARTHLTRADAAEAERDRLRSLVERFLLDWESDHSPGDALLIIDARAAIAGKEGTLDNPCACTRRPTATDVYGNCRHCGGVLPPDAKEKQG